MKRTSRSSTRRLEHLHTLRDMAELINSSLGLKEIRTRAIEATTKVLHAEGASLLLKNEETGELFFDVVTGKKAEKLKRIRLKKGAGIAGWVAEHGESLIVNDVASDPRFFSKADKVTNFKTRNIICTPVVCQGNIIGVLEGVNKKGGDFDAGDLEIIDALVHHIAVAVEKTKLYEQMKETFYKTVQVLAETIELRDQYTGGHTQRVHDYCVLIAQELELTHEIIEQLRLAALLHDIGKIGVRDELLLKPENLSSDEFSEIQMHSSYGAALLKPISQLEGVIPGVASHHERYNGTGYPKGLKGENIPLIARIIAVADTFDAMVSDRPYRKALTRVRALTEIETCSGTLFDPKVVKAFLALFVRQNEDSLIRIDRKVGSNHDADEHLNVAF